MYKFVESQIAWRFHKQNIEKTPQATIYTLAMTGRAQDISHDVTSTGVPYESTITDLFGDAIKTVGTIIITRYNKGGEKIKNHITASILPCVSSIRSSKGETFFETAAESHKTIREAAQKMIEAISEADGFMIPPRLTEAGKGALAALARKRDAELDICRITTKIADRKEA